MERTAVSSSNIVSIGYDVQSQTLEVEFKQSQVYQYSPVTKELYNQLMMSPSLGKALNNLIVKNKTILSKKLSQPAILND